MNSTKIDKLMDLLKDGNISIPKYIFFNYRKLNISDTEFIVIMYLISYGNNIIYNPKIISKELNIDIKKVLEIINSLSEKLVLSIKVEKNKSGVIEEYVSLDNFYKKISNVIIEDFTEEKKDNTIYKVFEEEFGRLLSPMEYQIINEWLNNDMSKELIIAALKEATYNGVNNLRYIDKILFAWKKKGFKKPEDVSSNKRNQKKGDIEIFDYDWLDSND